MNTRALIFGCWILAMVAHAQTPPKVSLTLKVDRPDAVYAKGQPATFLIEGVTTNTSATSSVVSLDFTKDLYKSLLKTQVTLVNGKASMTFTLDEPGFIQLRARMGKSEDSVAAAFSPEAIQPSMARPDDFADFWREQKEALARIPATAKVTPLTNSPSEKIEAFDVQVPCLGAPVSGYFGKPQGAKPGTLPAILFVHGAGVYSANAGSLWWALKEGGMLAMDINAHGIPNGRPSEYYQEMSLRELRDYRYIGQTNRNDCYFKGMFLRLVRAIDFLTTQPEWDGKTVIVYGSSQGGWQAFAAAGIDPRVTFFCAGVPAGCDHTGMMADRESGWPHLVLINRDKQPNPASLETARYFDAVNFASVAQCAGAAVTVGFLDNVCKPTTVFAAYNALKIPKQLHKDVEATHRSTPAANKFMEEAALAHVRRMKAVR